MTFEPLQPYLARIVYPPLNNTTSQVNLPPVQKALHALEKAGVPFEVYDRVRIEPTDTSFKECIDFVRKLQPDAILGLF